MRRPYCIDRLTGGFGQQMSDIMTNQSYQLILSSAKEIIERFQQQLIELK